MCSITRVTDNKHHPTDVLAGALLGTSVALAVSGFRCHPNTTAPAAAAAAEGTKSFNGGIRSRKNTEEIEFKVP